MTPTQNQKRVARLEELAKLEHLTRAELIELGISPTTVGLAPVTRNGKEVYLQSDIKRLAESGLIIQRR